MTKWAKYLSQNGETIGESIWQRNYYEHVIRNEVELNLTREYVIFNSSKWSFDRENPDQILDVDYSKKWHWLEGKR